MAKTMMTDGSYSSPLDVRQTVNAIKQIKDYFETTLADRLGLTRVSAPIFVRADSGLNDNLNGVERPVRFDLLEEGTECEVIHSLAKWKRMTLGRYGFELGEGLYTDMNAIRRDELTDNLHSIYVDQWDWEKIIAEQDRNLETLHRIVRDIYAVMLSTESMVSLLYPLKPFLPPEIRFITAQQLEDRYPELDAKEREHRIAREWGAVFLSQIGGRLRSGQPHDGRAPDYDDWSLNGDILVYYPVLDLAMELSSMGIRVNAEVLRSQLEISGCQQRAGLPFHASLLAGQLPQTIGGGIGQSRLCMLFLQKAHIGEVQSSVWPEAMIEECARRHIALL